MAAEIKQVIVIRRDLRMRQGKACSQTAHASSEFMKEALFAAINGEFNDKTISPVEFEWMCNGGAKITLRTDSEEQFNEIVEQAKSKGLKIAVITDAGHTEFKGVPTITAVAIGPDYAKRIDVVTGNLKPL